MNQDVDPGHDVTALQPSGARARRFAAWRLPSPWFAAVVAVSVVSAIPVRHYVQWLGDEGIWLRGAMEMLRGKVLYRDFWEFHGPLGFAVVAGWLGIFGQTIVAARALTAVLATLNAAVIFILCRRVSNSQPIAAFLALIWLFATQGDAVQLTHHSITTLISLAALWASLSGRPLLGGVFSGAAGMVTQTRGLLCAVATFASVVRMVPALPRFFLGLTLVPAAFGLYLLSQNALLDAWRDVVVWPLTSYSDIQGLPFGASHGTQHAWWAAFLYPLAMSGAAPFWRRWKIDATYRTSLNFAAAGLLGSFPRPDALHLAWTLPMALPLAAMLAADVGRRIPRRWGFALAAIAVCLALRTFIGFSLLLLGPALQPTATTPAGEIAFLEPEVPAMVRQVIALPADEPVFFYPYMPVVPFVTRREQVSRFDVFLPHYMSETQYESAARDVTKHAKWVVYDRLMTNPRYIRQIYPKMPETLPPEFRAMEMLLSNKYVTVWSNQRYEIRRAR